MTTNLAGLMFYWCARGLLVWEGAKSVRRTWNKRREIHEQRARYFGKWVAVPAVVALGCSSFLDEPHKEVPLAEPDPFVSITDMSLYATGSSIVGDVEVLELGRKMKPEMYATFAPTASRDLSTLGTTYQVQ